MYSKKNKDSYVQHVREVVYAVISTIFPYEIQHVLEDFYNLSTDTTMEQTNEADSILQEALIESYGKADTWQLNIFHDEVGIWMEFRPHFERKLFKISKRSKYSNIFRLWQDC
jgi:hypothetical protein